MSGNPTEFNAVLDLCQHEHCRIVLAALADRQSVTTNDLTAAIVEHVHRAPPMEVADETVARIETALYHVHLPKLEAAGFIEYAPGRQRVEPTERFGRGAPHLSAILGADPVLGTSLGA